MVHIVGLPGPAFLVTRNFDTVLRYNRSVRYVMEVALLARRIAGGPGFFTPWPTDDPGLSRAQVLTPLWTKPSKVENASWALALSPVQMTAKKSADDEETKKLTLSIPLDGEGGNLSSEANLLKSLLRNRHPVLPKDLKIVIGSDELRGSLHFRKRPTNTAARVLKGSRAAARSSPDPSAGEGTPAMSSGSGGPG